MVGFCAGIVSFQPDLMRLKQNLDAVTQQVTHVYIVDNHSEDLCGINRLLTAYINVTIIENGHNYGIAKALNQMSEQAICDGFDWILTLDQDSIIPDNLIENFTPYTKDNTIGIICPAVHYEGCKKVLKGKNETDYVKACMTSASLTRLDAWKTVGGYREDYFIDFVDNEFCMKLKLNGYKILRMNESVMRHQLGNLNKFKLFGIIRVLYSNHSPLRLYYMIRNNYVFIMEYKECLPYLREHIKLGYIIVTNIISANQKKESIYYILRGIRDAKRNKLGEYEK